MERKTKKIKLAGIRWHLKALVPADFFNCECWPFSMVMIDGRESEISQLRKKFSGPGLKDKRIEDEDKKIHELNFQIIFKGVISPRVSRPGMGGKVNYNWIKSNPELHARLIGEIATLSYGIDAKRDFGKYPLRLTKTFAQTIIFAARNTGVEPWALYSGKGPAALQNPLRWDFNLTLGSYGAELEAQALDEAMKKAKGKEHGRR